VSTTVTANGTTFEDPKYLETECAGR